MGFLEISDPLVKAGLSVIPVTPRAKAPLVGALSRSNDPAVVQAWATLYPDANVGIVSDDNFTILETDDLAELEDAIDASDGRDLPETRALGSGRPNRCAFLFKRTAACGDDCLNVPGLFEFRNRNQYVVGPGSIHPDGYVYKWLNDKPILEMPEWLVLALRKLDARIGGGAGGAHVSTAAANKLKELYLKKLDPQDLFSSDVRIGSNERHHTLLTVAGILHDGKRSPEDIAKILLEVRDRLCDNPTEKGDAEIYRLADYVCKRDPFTPTKVTLEGVPKAAAYEAVKFSQPKIDPPGASSDDDLVLEYVVNPKREFDGWFMRGATHLISGQSGAGKTTFMYDVLATQAASKDVFGHKTNGWTYLIVMADRGRRANIETCRRMRISPKLVPIEFLPICHDAIATQRIVEIVEKRGVPAVLFIEGADGLVEDANKVQVVAPFLSSLRELAEHYYMSIILSVGMGKLKKDGYANTRDKVFGSQIWTRMTDTLASLSIPGDGEGPERALSIQHRNEGTEKFSLTFEGGNGRLVLAAPKPTGDPLTVWVQSQAGEYRIEDAERELDHIWKPTQINNRHKELVAAGLVARVRRDAKGNIFRAVNPDGDDE